ncbi:MAG: prolyl oligopeptidase family serine peptidase [Balneolaceae bacterium]
MKYNRLRNLSLLVFGVVTGVVISCSSAEDPDPMSERGRDLWRDLAPYFEPPDTFAGEFGDYPDLFEFEDGSRVESASDWEMRREEIRSEWHRMMGVWPELLNDPEVEVLERDELEGMELLRIRFSWTPYEETEGYLLIPEGEEPRPAVIVGYYEPETAIGRGQSPQRDFARQLARRGFVTLSLGTTEGTENQTYTIYHPDINNAQIEPLSMLAYAAVTGWHLLANRPEVDSTRIGITGHSYGGKWAMFASTLFDGFAAAAWSDPGIVFDESVLNNNYWEPWYLGYHPKPWRDRGPITEENPVHGLYPVLREQGHDLTELHALMAPRPFLVSGGSADTPDRWVALNHTIAVNRLLGYEGRVGMSNRPDHSPNEASNRILVDFFDYFLMEKGIQRTHPPDVNP